MYSSARSRRQLIAKEMAAGFRYLYPVQFEGLGDFAENARGDFEALGRQLENFAFCLEVAGQREKDRHDEPAKQTTQKIYAEMLPLR